MVKLKCVGALSQQKQGSLSSWCDGALRLAEVSTSGVAGALSPSPSLSQPGLLGRPSPGHARLLCSLLCHPGSHAQFGPRVALADVRDTPRSHPCLLSPSKELQIRATGATSLKSSAPSFMWLFLSLPPAIALAISPFNEIHRVTSVNPPSHQLQGVRQGYELAGVAESSSGFI